MKLSEQQIASIRQLVAASYLDIRTLEEDLVDHLCCAVEQKLESGQDFQLALEKALEELAPAGLKRIEHDTNWLLNNNTVYMRKMMYLLGSLSAMAFVSGITLTLLQFPGARELMNYGFLVFMFTFVPYQAIEFYKANEQRALPEKLKFIFGFAGGIGLTFAGIFKTFHYQGAGELLIAGTVITVFGFLPFFFLSMYKKAVHA